MSTLPPPRTYNQSHTPRPHTGGRRISIYWTWSYPTKALLPMAALTKLAAETVVENIRQPVLMIYSETDTVIRPDLVKSVAGRWGGKAELYALPKNDDPSSHVIAGDALSPSTNKEVADKIVEWVKAQAF